MKPVHDPNLDLLTIFEARVGSALPEAMALRERIERRRLVRGQALFRAGDSVARLFLIKSGVLKFTYVSESGVERVRDFVVEGQIAACIGALGDDGTARYDGIACEDVVVESIAFAPICRLSMTEPSWARCMHLLLYDVARDLGERERMLLTLAPVDRLAHALAERPWLSSRVAQQDLAAYIGITPVSLSRLKARARRVANACRNTVDA